MIHLVESSTKHTFEHFSLQIVDCCVPAMAMYKCRKCRLGLLSQESLLTCHNSPLTKSPIEDQSTTCATLTTVLFVDEQKVQDWMRQQIDEANWTKGRITCPGNRCGARIGSFNFVGGVYCACSKNELPPIQIIRSKVDEPTVQQNETTSWLTFSYKSVLCMYKHKIKITVVWFG